jgi:hypothetical protein
VFIDVFVTGPIGWLMVTLNKYACTPVVIFGVIIFGVIIFGVIIFGGCVN